MTYLTKDEFVTDLGFDDVTDFEKLAKRAEIAINLYTQNILTLRKRLSIANLL